MCERLSCEAPRPSPSSAHSHGGNNAPPKMKSGAPVVQIKEEVSQDGSGLLEASTEPPSSTRDSPSVPARIQLGKLSRETKRVKKKKEIEGPAA